MVLYECDRCEKTFDHKSAFDKHNKMKRNCALLGSSMCIKCGKTYKHKQSLARHKRTCNFTSSSNNLQQNNIQNTNNILNNNVNVDNMKVVKFGNENLSYMTDDLYKQIMGRGFSAISEFIEYSHFNPKHPENHNVYIANLRNKYVVFYDGDKWMVSSRGDIMEDIIYAKSDLLFSKFRDLRHEMNQADIERFMRYINERDSDKTMDRLKNEITLQLYNNRKLPQKMRQYMEKCELLAHTTNIEDNFILKDIITSLGNLDDSKLKDIQLVLNKIL